MEAVVLWHPWAVVCVGSGKYSGCVYAGWAARNYFVLKDTAAIEGKAQDRFVGVVMVRRQPL